MFTAWWWSATQLPELMTRALDAGFMLDSFKGVARVRCVRSHLVGHWAGYRIALRYAGRRCIDASAVVTSH
jgi:hypothetical protein